MYLQKLNDVVYVLVYANAIPGMFATLTLFICFEDLNKMQAIFNSS